MAHEINLVPDVKQEVIKTQKMRNLVFFICVVVSAAAAGLVVLLASISGGQSLALSSQDSRIEAMSNKLKEYDSLPEFLTIQSQLGKLSQIGDNKKVLSRVFSILDVLLPNGVDTISISELNVNLEESTLTFDGQADAKEEPLIDYRVLDAFKKSMAMMRYDYGRYVDENNQEIPTRCIEEADGSGKAYIQDGKTYAIWKKGEKGCNPSAEEDTPVTNERVKIWRTPKLEEWVEAGHVEALDGQAVVSGIPHFDSQCIKYFGTRVDNVVKWTANNECKLVVDEVNVTDSSNGRDAAGNLVLRFSAMIKLTPEVFKFNNKHMVAIGPTGRQNVTDSYIQVKKMFEERASDCAVDDESCNVTENKDGTR